jgi:glycosyltransferase involved in cell wall biosynthesis
LGDIGLKIAIASSGLGHVTRGIEAWAQELAAALHARGERVTLFKGSGTAGQPYERVVGCIRRDHAVARLLDSGLPQRIAWRCGLGTAYGVEQAAFAARLLPYLRGGSYDVLHVQDPRVAVLAQWANRLRLVPTRVILGHGTNEPPAFLRRIEYLQHLAPSHMHSARRAGTWRDTWTVIPNFIDTERFSPGVAGRDELRDELQIPRQAVVVLTVAAIKRDHKRVDHLIREFARLRARAPHLPAWLVAAGARDAQTDEVITLGHQLLGDRFRGIVGIDRRRMPDVYRAADVFVLASLREMMPVALLEATATGLPCVVNRHPSLEWIVGAGGEIIDMQASGELGENLQALIDDARRRRKLGEAARQHCVRYFGVRNVTDRILDYYRFVIRGALPGQQRADLCFAS